MLSRHLDGCLLANKVMSTASGFCQIETGLINKNMLDDSQQRPAPSPSKIIIIWLALLQIVVDIFRQYCKLHALTVHKFRVVPEHILNAVVSPGHCFSQKAPSKLVNYS